MSTAIPAIILFIVAVVMLSVMCCLIERDEL